MIAFGTSAGASAASGYRLALPQDALAGRFGDRLGSGVGSSIEFADFRDYQPGDDLRHVDWRSYARTDQLKVRLYREEIAPVLDVIVDASASMGSTAIKAAATRDLVAAAGVWAQRLGGVARVQIADVGRAEGALEFGGEQRALRNVERLAARGLRMVISDFLFPEDPASDLRRLASGCGYLWVLQVLDPSEVDPSQLGSAATGAVTLIDCEQDQRIDLMLDPSVIEAYRQRLTRLSRGVENATRRAGGRFVQVTAAPAAVMFRDDLLPGAVVDVA